MSENHLISVIVPVFNAQKSITRCVESIQCQSFSDWELILSDDGSEDDSLSICLSLARNDARIRVISNQHGGVSCARNAALDVSIGDFVCFIDADDVVDSNYLKILYEHHNYDMVVCGYWVDWLSHNFVKKNCRKYVQPEKFYDFSHKENMNVLFESGIMHMNWNKFFQKRIIDTFEIRFKPFPVNEDFIFVMEYLMHCKNLYVVNKATYHWIRVKNALSGVESIPDNLLAIYNESHKLLLSFFSSSQKVADEIMYYSYELIALKYLRAIKQGNLSKLDGNKKLKLFHRNDLVKKSFSAHHPKSIGTLFYYWLLRLGFFRIYSILNIN